MQSCCAGAAEGAGEVHAAGRAGTVRRAACGASRHGCTSLHAAVLNFGMKLKKPDKAAALMVALALGPLVLQPMFYQSSCLSDFLVE